MIAFLRGKLHTIRTDSLVIDVNGVGYLVYTSSRTLTQLPSLGEEIEIQTYMHIREDAVLLFGFLDHAQLSFFLLLIEVSGIGPKVALGILSAAGVADLSQAIIREDVNWLTKLPGVGKKTAQRLLIELKDKIGRGELNNLSIDLAGTAVHHANSAKGGTDIYAEASEALAALGYLPAEIRSAMEWIKSNAGDKTELQQVIRLALRYLTKG